MTAPSGTVRRLTYTRDGFACVNCGSFDYLTFQHRAAVGMGGAGSKSVPVTPADGVTACNPCNTRFEGDLQSRALANGWKLRRNRGGMLAADIPYFDTSAGAWFLPDVTGHRFPVGELEALGLLVAAGSIGRVA